MNYCNYFDKIFFHYVFMRIFAMQTRNNLGKMSDKSNDININELLNNLFAPSESLRDLFTKRIEEIELSETAALELININYRTLNGILNGTQKTVDYTNLIKLADFLQISSEQVFNLYTKELRKNFNIEKTSNPEKVKFIKENFDLAALKKAGLINDIGNYEDIENKIMSLLGLRSIFEYRKPRSEAAFSAGKIKPKNELTRHLWVNIANSFFEEINNPHEFDRDGLIKYFPEIRWHSTNVELGLINVIKALYRFGITVIYQKPFNSLHLRGATFSVNNKPSIVLTDYKGFYPTIWFALVHELFHVIFDWEEISENKYHLSDPTTEQLTIIDKEREANDFAREYLFSKEKTKNISGKLHSDSYIDNYAQKNHVHPSFIYVFYAYDVDNRSAWATAKIKNPSIDKLVSQIGFDWSKPTRDYINVLRNRIYK